MTRYGDDPAESVRAYLARSRREPSPAEIAASALGDLLSGYGPDARADLLDALKADLAEGGSLTVTCISDDEDRGLAMSQDRTWTDPDVLGIGIEQGWAERETDPRQIGWPARQAAAAIPFAIVGGRPVNPSERTSVRYGRNGLGLWGENLMADALVTASAIPGGQRYLLMVERRDGYGWAVPGGSVERGETGTQAAVRELAEETGLSVPEPAGRAMPARYVPDPRASDEAWAVTVPVAIGLGRQAGLPFVTGADDARRAAWVRADSYASLTADLAGRFGDGVFPAHVAMLAEFLGGAR